MCNEPSPGGNLLCTREVGPDGTHEGGHIWVATTSQLPKSMHEEGDPI